MLRDIRTDKRNLQALMVRVLLAGVTIAFVPSSGTAQTSVAKPQPSGARELLETTWAVGALGVTVWLGGTLNAETCRWCDRDENEQDTLNGFDRTLRRGLLWKGSKARTADTISDVAQYTTWTLPAVLLATSKRWTLHDRYEGVRMVMWAGAVNFASTAIMKRAFARERPFVHFKNAQASQTSEKNGSFPSGHTSSTFASVFSAARACRLLDCGHERRLWVVGIPLASFTGVLRISADKHYTTDVLAGAGVGAAIGWLTPHLYSRAKGNRRLPDLQPIVGRASAGAVGTWTW